jgi:DNA-binding MurR/RpiR family transcriptional regulator
MVQRLSICGFMIFNNVHFYDFMIFQQDNNSESTAMEPSIMFAVSQSGETEPVINDVRYARQQGYEIISFTRRDDSTLARLSDIVFIVDGSKQTLVGGLPNRFFGHVILAFEELMGYYFTSFLPTAE